MRSLAAFAFVLAFSASAHADPPRDPCAGRVGVIDGVDEDGVVCDYAAQQAALERFATLTAAADAAKFVAPACDLSNRAAVGAKLAGAQEWIKASDRAHRAEAVTDREIADTRQALAAERANPAGVVSLARLHEFGEALQAETATKTKQRAEALADRGHATKLMAEAKAAMDACKRSKAH